MNNSVLKYNKIIVPEGRFAEFSKKMQLDIVVMLGTMSKNKKATPGEPKKSPFIKTQNIDIPPFDKHYQQK